MFHDCHERVWDGSQLQAKYGKNKMIRSFYYHRLEWPDMGGAMEQDNRIVEIFDILNDEHSRMLAAKIK